MKRAKAVNFLAIQTNNYLNIKADFTMSENLYSKNKDFEKFEARFPIQAYKLLRAYEFEIKVVALDHNNKELFTKNLETDSYGGLLAKIPLPKGCKDCLAKIEAYEISKYPGLELHLGTFIPLKITDNRKIIICDFDKTLVETKYSKPSEIYDSLTSPLKNYPTLENSVKLLKSYIEMGYHPFILSASPHFYEDAIRDWLYANEIFTAGIFLKDYRRILSILENDLTPKDIKTQGIYKLGHLLDIVNMTDIPSSVVLMGDNFESDPLIYLTFSELMSGRVEPRQLWNELKRVEDFKVTARQNGLFLNKIFQIKDNVKHHGLDKEVKIYIRKKGSESQLNIRAPFNSYHGKIELYDGNLVKEDSKKQIEAQAPTE
ncbi:phosphatase domain-containing protein [Halobacteriovorax sp. RZ-1]|uniref:phosphatase domain-containing protein n=1 Tax=unclassified Halobacteriovorax TaxID=2639665 RepID=UPI00370F7706